MAASSTYPTPSHRSVIIEADGGSRGNPGPAGFGALIRDADTGEVIAEAAESIGRATNNVAEYRGLIAGLELYVEHTPDALLEVRMDSKLVIEQMAGRWKVKHPDMRPLAVAAQRLSPFGTVWTWVPRERNGAADHLANLAMDAAARGEVYDARDASSATTPADVGDPRSAASSPESGQPVQAAPGEAESSAPQPESSSPRRRSLRSGHNEPGDPTPDAMEPGEPDVSGDPGSAATAVPGRPANPMVGWDGTLGEPTTIVFLRHGETRHTSAKRFSGPGGDDPGLIDVGWEQARRAADTLAVDGGFEAIVSSPMRRTRETAKAVSETLGLPVQLAEGFRECAFGEWDGYTYSEVKQRSPDELLSWLHSMAVAPPGGESIVEVQQRVEETLLETLSTYAGKKIVVVSHVNPIKLAVRYCLDAPLDSLHRMLLAPASLTTLSFYESGASVLRQFSALP
ncbi:MAG: bifunctional RNase H/acid phosphatase [Nocardioidaceae bacterium]|nr:bifunctional RNase H/acid phosphatase [Nocardioidaceae bacterium]